MSHMRAEKECPVEDPAPQGAGIRRALAQMVRGMTQNAALREDLLQEALVHLWLTETRRPGQTPSWYLQSCKFHLQHYLNGGRSIDSAKRWRDRLPLPEHAPDDEAFDEPADSGNSVLTSVSAREIISLLSAHLSSQEIAVLHCLADGLGAREIGRHLNLSHTMVIRYRRKIATLFKRLELSPFVLSRRSANGQSANGHAHKQPRSKAMPSKPPRAPLPAKESYTNGTCQQVIAASLD